MGLGKGILREQLLRALCPARPVDPGRDPFTVVKAEHSDPVRIGVILESEGKRLCITGDTLYSTEVLVDLSGEIDMVFLPMNGPGNNMNAADAVRFAADCGARRVPKSDRGRYLTIPKLL